MYFHLRKGTTHAIFNLVSGTCSRLLADAPAVSAGACHTHDSLPPSSRWTTHLPLYQRHRVLVAGTELGRHDLCLYGWPWPSYQIPPNRKTSLHDTTRTAQRRYAAAQKKMHSSRTTTDPGSCRNQLVRLLIIASCFLRRDIFTSSTCKYLICSYVVVPRFIRRQTLANLRDFWMFRPWSIRAVGPGRGDVNLWSL